MKANKNSWSVYLKHRLKDPNFREGFERETRILKLGMALAKQRESRGLTQEAVAKRIGTSAPHVSRTEKTPENANVKTLLRYAEALDMTLQMKLVPRRKQSAAKAASRKTSRRYQVAAAAVAHR